MNITRRIDTVYVRALHLVYDNISLVVHTYDIREQLRVRNMSDKDKYTVNREELRFTGFDVFERGTGHFVRIAVNFFHDSIPYKLDFVVFEGAFLHNLACPELIAAMDDVDLGGVFG